MRKNASMKDELSFSDFRTIADLHSNGIPFGFLSTLGPRFLAKLYSGIADSPGSCLLVERDAQGQVIGFVSGSLSIRACYRYVLRRNFISLGFLLLPHLFSLANFRRILETLKYPFKKQATQQAEGVSDVSTELLSIAVADCARGKGVGKKLVRSLEAFFLTQGYCGAYKVVTWAEDARSNAFYRSAGFVLHREFFHHGNKMNEYRKALQALV